MDIKQLITFKTATETLNFTKTASILNFAQSSVTAQIKALEEELEKPLFERLGKRLTLTEAGKEFKIYAEKIIKLNEEAKWPSVEIKNLLAPLSSEHKKVNVLIGYLPY